MFDKTLAKESDETVSYNSACSEKSCQSPVITIILFLSPIARRSIVSPPGETEGGGGGKFHGVDLLQHSPSPSPGDPFPLQPRSLEPVTDTFHQNLPLRKTHSDLDTTSPAGLCDYQGRLSQCISYLFPLCCATWYSTKFQSLHRFRLIISFMYPSCL